MRFVGRRGGVGAALLATLALVAAACAEDEPEDFTADNRTAFLTACAQPLEDDRLISEICECVFDETQGQLGFERFREIDGELLVQADDEAETELEPRLPDDLAEIIAACVVTEAEL